MATFGGRDRAAPILPERPPPAPPEREPDADPISHQEHFSLLMQGDLSQLLYFAHEYKLDPALVTDIDSPVAFFALVTTLFGRDDDSACTAFSSMCELIDADEADFSFFTDPAILEQVCAPMHAADPDPYIQRGCCHFIMSLLSKYPDIYPVLYSLGFVAALPTLLRAEPCVGAVCDALLLLVDHPGAESVTADLWQIAIALIRIDATIPKIAGLRAMTGLLRVGAVPFFDEGAVSKIAKMGVEGVKVLRRLFKLLLAIDDRNFLSELVDRGLIEKLVSHIEYRSEDAFIVYRFFEDIQLEPATELLRMSVDWAVERAPHRVLLDIIKWIDAVGSQVSRDDWNYLVDKGMVDVITEMVAASGPGEDALRIVTFCGRILTVFATDVDVAADPRFACVNEEFEKLSGLLSAEVDEQIHAVLAFFGE